MKKIMARSNVGQGKLRARSGQAQDNIKTRSRKGHQGKVKAKPGNVKGGSRQGQGKVKAR